MDKDTQIITSEFHEILGAFDQINDAILIIDPASEQIINSNLSAQILYGYSKQEFSHLQITDISKEITKFRVSIYATVTQGETKTFETKQISKSGTEILIEISPSLVTYNNRTAILCVGRDIRERKEIEEQLKKSEEKYRMLVEGLNVITWIYDIEKDNYTYVSNYAEQILGYPLEIWFGGNFWFNIVHPDDRDEILTLSNNQIKIGEDYECEYRVITSKGEVKWFKDITSVYKINQKVRKLQGVLIDITDRKKTEQALNESEEQLFMIFEHSPIGKTLTTIKGDLLRVNTAFCNLVGYTKEELYKTNFQSLTHTDDLKANMEIIQKTIDEGRDSFTFRKRYLRKDGGIVQAETNVSILRDKNGKPDRFVAQVIDITQRVEDQKKLEQTQNRLGALLNNLSDIVFYESDAKGVFISDNIKEMLGYSSKDFAKDSGFFEKIMHKDDREKINKQVKSWQVEDNPGSLNFEFRVKKKDGSYVWIEDHMFGIKNDDRSYWAGFMIDVTGRKHNEQKLEEIQTRLGTILNNLPNVIFYESEKDRVFVSDNVKDIIGYTSKEVEEDNSLFVRIIHPDDLLEMKTGNEIWEKVLRSKYYKQQFRVKKKNGEYIWLEDNMYAVTTGEKDYIVGFMMDITERKITEQRLEETQMRLAAVLNNLPNVVFYENTSGKQFISENIMEMLGYPVEDFYGNPDLFDSLIHKDDLPGVIEVTNNWHLSGAKGTYRETFRIKKKSGEYIWLEDHMFKSQRQDGENYFSGVMIDITEMKNIEEKLADSVKEKELLIKEIHHRVKNNLQVVSSLLKLQSTYIKDSEALDMLIDSQNRVQSMAIVHQKLYQSKDLANIDIRDYIQQLLYYIIDSAEAKENKIVSETDIAEATIGVDTAIPCGLIINELVSNSMKHAFSANEKGTIKITLQSAGEKSYTMVISDNGKGFPADIDFRNTSSLGLQLVLTLVKQLEGNVEMKSENGNGTCFEIHFKDIG